MSRTLALLLAAAVALLAAAPAAAAAGPASLPDVEDEVMCPSCNVPLNVADSPQADDQRTFIRGLIAQGKSKEEVKEALVAEYGSDVLAVPKDDGFGLAATVVPIALVAALLAALALLLPRWRRRGAPARAPAGGGPALSAADAARLDEDLRRYDR